MKKYIIAILIWLFCVQSAFALSWNEKNLISKQISVFTDNYVKKISKWKTLEAQKSAIDRLVDRVLFIQKNRSSWSAKFNFVISELIKSLSQASKNLDSRIQESQDREPAPVPTSPISSHSSGYGLSDAQIKNIVDTHNIYRSEVWVKGISWSNTVADSAEKWAKQLQSENCAFKHSTSSFRSGYGENLYYFWSSTARFTGDNSVGAIRSFGEEKHDYNYDSNTCAPWKVCGHYTQVVWEDTTKVGCARVSCNSNGYKEIYVCQYDPAGNYIGEKPY